jgi:hypothetical protein
MFPPNWALGMQISELKACVAPTAMKLGIEKNAMIRVRAGISYALTEAMDDGHCGLATDVRIPMMAGSARCTATIQTVGCWAIGAAGSTPFRHFFERPASGGRAVVNGAALAF